VNRGKGINITTDQINFILHSFPAILSIASENLVLRIGAARVEGFSDSGREVKGFEM